MGCGGAEKGGRGRGGLTSERAWKAVSLVVRVIDMLYGWW